MIRQNTAAAATHGTEETLKAIAQLRAEHHELDERLRMLGRHLSLSPEEELEFRAIKKLKLQKKDLIQLLEARVREEMSQ